MSRWFRLYEDLVDDPKVQQLEPETFKFLVNCWCIASKLGGRLPDVKQIAFQNRMRVDRARRLLATLQASGLIDQTDQGLVPHNWQGRQYKSDVSTDRVKRFRERKNSGNETFQKRPQSTDTDTDTTPVAVVPSPPRDAVAALRVRLVSLWQERNTDALPPDTGIAAVWIARGYEPDLIAAVITSRFPRGKRPPRSWNYFDEAIADEHERRRATNGAATAANGTGTQPMTPEKAEWWRQYRADAFFGNDEWRDPWGPRPGEPNCDIPEETLLRAAQKAGRQWPPEDRVRH